MQRCYSQVGSKKCFNIITKKSRGKRAGKHVVYKEKNYNELYHKVAFFHLEVVLCTGKNNIHQPSTSCYQAALWFFYFLYSQHLLVPQSGTFKPDLSQVANSSGASTPYHRIAILLQYHCIHYLKHSPCIVPN